MVGELTLLMEREMRLNVEAGNGKSGDIELKIGEAVYQMMRMLLANF